MTNRAQAPHIKEAIDFNLHLPPYESYTLSNGVPVYEINMGAQEVAQIEFVFYAGNSFEQKQSIAPATNSLLINGTTNKTAYQLHEAFDYYGAFCSRSCYNETAVIKLNSLSKHLPKVLPVVAEMLAEATFPEEELATYQQNSKQRLSVNLLKSDFVASRLIDVYLYGKKHPYGSYTTAEDIDAMQVEDLRNFYKEYYREGNCIIFVSGKFDVSVQEQLNKYFGFLPLRPPVKKLPAAIAQPELEKKHRIMNDEKSVQGAIRLGRSFVNRHHPDFTKLMVLNTVFGGYFGSRLMSNIREEKGYTYGIYSYAQNHMGESGLVVATDAGKDVCEAAIQEVFKEMDILKSETIDAEELELVRNYMIGSILGSLDGPFQVMAKWKNMILNNLPQDSFYRSIEDIKTTSAKDLQRLAGEYLNKEDFYDLVVY